MNIECHSYHILPVTCFRKLKKSCSSYVVSSKCIKIHSQKIPSIGRNVSEYFYVPMYSEYLSDLNKNYHVAFTDDTKAEYQI